MNRIIIVVISLALMILTGCINHQTNQIIDGNITNSFKKNYKVVGLFDHFPISIKSKVSGKISFPPSNILAELKCDNREAEIVIIGKKNDYLEEMKKANYQVYNATNYFDTVNFIIDIPELKRTLFPVKKCNKYFIGKLPLPYFENYDFGLGEKEILEKQINGESHPHYHTVYNVPEDLKVYVIEARAGDFWKFDCKENRTESLGKWKHGYSKGIAISDKYNKVVFWLIVW